MPVRSDMICNVCGSVLSAVTFTCVRGKYCKPRERYMTVLGGYKLDMENHGHLVRDELPPIVEGKDYGADPVGDGTFKMVPSGDIVSHEERNRRLAHYETGR